MILIGSPTSFFTDDCKNSCDDLNGGPFIILALLLCFQQGKLSGMKISDGFICQISVSLAAA